MISLKIFNDFKLTRYCRKAVTIHGPYHFNSYDRKYSKSNLYCMNAVRKFDYENYISTLLLPKECRLSAFAIRAFNVEIAQIKDIVSNITIGKMRMQFWRDTIDLIYKNTPRESPVARDLHSAVCKHNLTKEWFTNIIQAREKYLSNRAFFSLKEAEDYAENSTSSLIYLLLECLGIKNANADHAASHIGRCHGLVTMLRAIPYNGMKQQVFLPVELMMHHGVSEEDVIRGRIDQNFKDLIYDIASNANQHLTTARSLQKDIPKSTHKAFLNTVTCENYLKDLQKNDFNVFHPLLQERNNLLPLQLWLRKLKRTY